MDPGLDGLCQNALVMTAPPNCWSCWLIAVISCPWLECRPFLIQARQEQLLATHITVPKTQGEPAGVL